MSNEDILSQRWKKTDKTLKDYLKRFRSISTETLDKLVEVFDTLDITYTDLNRPISKDEKRRLDRKIKEWKKQGLLTGYFAYLISKKSKYTYSDLLEILVYGVYVEQEEKIKSASKEVFTIVAKDVYSQALKEIPVKPKKKFSLTWEFIWSLLWIPTYNKSWDNYIQLLTMNNYQEAYKQIVQVIQQNKDLNDSMLKDLMKKQCNRILSINDDKYSGVLSDTCIALGNKVYTEPFKDEDDLKVRFIAVIDSKTTKMCRGMNNMLFYVNKTNKFFRYSDYDGRDVYYECKGLVGGINLPPILNHFHWCRSTITYLIDTPDIDLLAEYNEFKVLKDELNIEVPDKLEEYADLRYNKDGYIDELKLKREIYRDFKRQVEAGTEGERTSFQKYYDKYVDSRKIAGTITNDNTRVGDMSPHAIYRMASRNISAKEIIDILNKSDHIPDTGHESLVYTIDERTKVVLTNTDYHNVKTVMKTRGKV